MVTKNFLFFLVSLIAADLFAGCQSIEIKHQAPQPYPVKVEQGQPTPVPQTPTTQNPNANAGLPQVPMTQPPAPPTLNGVPTGKLLPVGVWLGPGAIRSFAHIGVLRALQKSQVPIVAIGGMEWGSLVAASFATSRGANEVEWEMMKLRKKIFRQRLYSAVK